MVLFLHPSTSCEVVLAARTAAFSFANFGLLFVHLPGHVCHVDESENWGKTKVPRKISGLETPRNHGILKLASFGGYHPQSWVLNHGKCWAYDCAKHVFKKAQLQNISIYGKCSHIYIYIYGYMCIDIIYNRYIIDM